MASDGFMKGKPLPRIELLAAMIIFILPLLFPLIGILAATGVSLPKWTDYVLQILFWGAVLLPLGLALIKGFPSWSLSYLGLILMLSIILGPSDGIWGWIYPSFTQLFGPRSYWSLPIGITYAAAFEFILVSSILVSALILANLLRLLPHTRGVWQRIRADWTQLSFMCYGGLVFSVLLTLDEYQYAEIGRIMAWLCLALGAWLYLRVGGQKLRILSLICGATGAMWIVALAKWVLIPLQAWPSGYPVAPSEATRWVEAGSAMVGWVCTLLMLIAPTLLRLLPQAPDPIVSSEGDPVTA